MIAYLGLGSNLGDKLENLKNACNLLEQEVGKIEAVSSIYETEPWGVENQDTYLNAVIKINTPLWPLELLRKVLSIEAELGRVRIKKWGSRCIDIDILFFQDLIVTTPQLSIPHPFIAQRKFVLQPFCEIDSQWIHPQMQKTMQELLEQTSDTGQLKILPHESFNCP